MRSIYILFFVAVLAGCGSRKEYRASDLELERISWDSLRVDVDFSRRQVIGGARDIEADIVLVIVFNERYDTLYAGTSGLIRIEDASLGDRERLTVEACGKVLSREICVQETMEASPKRVSVQEEIEYPTGEEFAEGNFDFSFRAERRRFVAGGWEPIPGDRIKGHLEAWIDDPVAKEEGTVSFTFSNSHGRFDLSRHPNFRHFKYHLESGLLDEETVPVRFDIYAGVGSKAALIASVTKEVHQKSQEERSEEVRYFVEQALEKIIDELGSILGARRAVAFMEEWSYESSNRSYRVEMEAEWDGPMFDRGHFEIGGILEVMEDGSNAVFRITHGNRRAERRWRDRTERESLSLGDLELRENRSETR